MRGTNGAAAEPVDEDDDDDDFDFDLNWDDPRSGCWALIAGSRKRQGKPALLTPEEQSLTREECELLLNREREAETAFDKAKADREHIKQLRWWLPFEFAVFAAGAGLWLLAYAGWLPEGFATRDMQSYYVLFAGLGLVHGVLGYLDLRATRLGTKRAERLFGMAKWTVAGLFIAACVLGIGAFLLMIGAALYDSWIIGKFDYVLLFFLGMVLVKLFILVVPWIELLEKPTAVLFALIAFAVLITGYLTTIGYVMWPKVLEGELWPVGFITIPFFYSGLGRFIGACLPR